MARSKASRVIIEFPTLMARERFLGWLSDGGGEYAFMEGEEVHAPSPKEEINKFDYSRAFPAWGYNPVKHGPDKVVVCKHVDD
jgi:hypothetical protein